jgi:hypothetical protein
VDWRRAQVSRNGLKEWRSRRVVDHQHGKLVIRNLDPLIKTADIAADRRAVTQPRNRRDG